MRRGATAAILLLAAIVPGAAVSSHSTPYRAEHVRFDGVAKLNATARAAVDWCGAGSGAAVDRTPALELTSARQVHVTYAIPADSADQLSSMGSRIATDIAAMVSWWQGQDPARTIRFDYFPFPGCSSKAGALDIGFIRLPRVGALYVGEAGLDRLAADLGPLAALSTQKHLVYYDGQPIFDNRICGTAFVPPSATTQGGFAGIAFVWLHSLCGFDVGSSGLNAAVAAHELLHGLGPLTQPGAPNECAPPDNGHVCDSPADILYPSVTSTTRLSNQILDVNRDDYYGHAGFWFDVQDSIWLTHLPQFTLSVAFQGRAAGASVRVVTPGAFNCTQSCSLAFDAGTAVTLLATPRPGERFAGWSGACSGAGTCTVTMDAAKNVTATFALTTVSLLVQVKGKGKVVSTPAGISCPRRCSAAFTVGSKVRLRAKPAKGFRFAGWSGSCRGTGACTLTADRARAARAVFRKKG